MGEKMTLEEAMRRAFDFGETYWAQADSGKRLNAYETRRQFEELVRETVGTHLTQPAQAVDVGAIREVVSAMQTLDPRFKSFGHDRWVDKLTAALPNANGKEG